MMNVIRKYIRMLFAGDDTGGLSKSNDDIRNLNLSMR